VEVALQGPLSAILAAEMAASTADAAAIKAMKMNDVRRATLNLTAFGPTPVILAGTGYTGEESGFEIFIHPDRAPVLWKDILAKGAARGVRAAGLGARDSLRTEAGLPLFGHDLEGPEQLSLTECGYGFVCRFHTPYFIGRDAYVKRLAPRQKRVIRLKGQGRKSVRTGHVLLDENGRPVGVVTSFAFANPEFDYYVLAAVKAACNPRPEVKLCAARLTVEQLAETLGLKTAEPRIALFAETRDLRPILGEAKLVELTAQTRLPNKAEKRSWRENKKP
jgi:glycine hydroxymethyltransferase